MITVENVKYSYDKTTPVLHGISFSENEPVIIGLWGRNGAGKTTLMKLLAGHQQASEGNIEIMGHAPYNNAEAQQHLCYMQEDHPFSQIWSVKDAMRFAKYFNPNWNQSTADKLLKVFKLQEHKKTSKLSTGMKTALQLVIGVASQASVTILDEPTNGLDAGMRKKFYEVLLESYEEHPRLILLSTHHIEEVQPLCESLIVIHQGSVLLNETLDELREKGIWLTGDKEKVDELSKGLNILEKKEVGSVKKVMIDAPFSKEWKERAHANGLSLEKADLQDYLLNITDEKEIRI
ncbi:ABC transporter ATP-binding protein [Bacillus horti]|uniref:ABC-2 type transport system ATP-binding protein n=1 Tax=Caldalkalibacillus horti TaxID=77523 RepID=A0ABT9VZ21_9BACI|nr:ABC transporter ATP-binding protein [Bacillus horti]MDQ0166241.1 ABC-2 type transport system ATP-binding protein [Bacillus horti]